MTRTHDARPLWDQLLDDAPPDWAKATRDVGDSLFLASSILWMKVKDGDPPWTISDAIIIAREIRLQRAQLAQPEETQRELPVVRIMFAAEQLIDRLAEADIDWSSMLDVAEAVSAAARSTDMLSANLSPARMAAIQEAMAAIIAGARASEMISINLQGDGQ